MPSCCGNIWMDFKPCLEAYNLVGDQLKIQESDNWRPGNVPTKDLLTLISSRIKTQRRKGIIREGKNPQVPSLLLEEKQTYLEGEDRVKYLYFPTCWRCGQRCQFCLNRKKHFPNFGNFTMEIASPFLDVLEEILSTGDIDEDVQEDEEDEMMSSDEEEQNHQNMMKCLSEGDFQENYEEEGDDNEENNSKDSTAEEQVISEDDI